MAEFVLVPIALTAAIRKSYALPLVSPVTIAPADVETPSSKVSHVPDDESLY